MQLHSRKIIKLSSILKKYKSLHSILKKVYFKFNYLFFVDKNFKYHIENGTKYKLPLKNKDFFFGYYHHSPWSYDDKFIAINSLLDSKTIEIIIINIETLDSTIIDNTTLWNFQQGPMLGWVPEKHVIYYNKLVNNEYKTILYNISNNYKEEFNSAIQTIHPDGDCYLSINYQELNNVNPDYGYKEKCKKLSNTDNGIWECFFDNNINPKLIVSINDMKAVSKDFKNNYNNELNHCLYSDDGNHIIFIYRYKNNGYKFSKLILIDLKSSNFNMIQINKYFISHMCWIDNHNIFYFGDSSNGDKGYYKYNIINSQSTKMMPGNLTDGHPSINKDKQWIILDTYPDSHCNNHLYLYNLKTLKLITVGKFKSNISLQGYNRCDLHPRWNNKGTQIMIDTSFRSKRAPFIIDLEEIIYEKK